MKHDILNGTDFKRRGYTGKGILASLAVALAAYQSLYPIILIIPVALMIANQPSQPFSSSKLSCTVLCCMAWLTSLLAISYFLTGSWDFIHSVYYFIVTVPDLTPNIGLYWYYFLEMFDHFRVFFLWTFQLHILIYIGPLTVRFRQHPTVLFTLLVGIVTVFQPYPCIGDAALLFALVSQLSYLAIYMRYTFPVANMYVYSSLLGPIFWHLWIYAGSGNANFFFAITLVYSLATVLLIIDIIQAHQRREYDLTNGITVPVPGAEIISE